MGSVSSSQGFCKGLMNNTCKGLSEQYSVKASDFEPPRPTPGETMTGDHAAQGMVQESGPVTFWKLSVRHAMRVSGM